MLMKTRILFLLVFVAFCCSSAMAQIQQIKGTVVSDNDSEPMIGVAILENGTTNGCITDLNGNYSIQVQNSNATLTVSFVGYKTQTIKVNGRNQINIRMQEDLKVLDEVVVVGLAFSVRVTSLVPLLPSTRTISKTLRQSMPEQLFKVRLPVFRF